MESDLSFNAGGFEMVRLCANGDIYVKEKLITSDCQLVDGLRMWLKTAEKVFGNGSIVSHTTVARKNEKPS